MKILLAFAVVVATTYAADFTEETLSKEYTLKVMKELKKCKAMFPSISDDDFKKLSTDKKMPSTRDEECFALCYAKKRGYYKGPGKIRLRKLQAGNSKKYKNPTNLAAANSIDETCVKRVKKETDECKTASNFYVCRATEARRRGFKFAKYNKG